MRLGDVAGCLAVSGPQRTDPLRQLGATSLARRAAIALKQAGVFPLVVAMPQGRRDLVSHLADLGVVFLEAENPAPQLMDVARLGLGYLAPRCDRVAFTQANCPLFSPATVLRLLEEPGDAVLPSYKGRSGHPVVLDGSVISEVLAYDGDRGLQGALGALGDRRRWVEVDDPGCVASAKGMGDDDPLVQGQSAALARPALHLRLERERPFFDERAELLLHLVGDTGSMRAACRLMGLSYAKGWGLVNELEEALGRQVVLRQRGGRDGGSTMLAPGVASLLERYRQLERELSQGAQARFAKLLPELAGPAGAEGHRADKSDDAAAPEGR